MLSRHSRTFAVQNGLAALVFALLFSGEALAYLLHAFPAAETLWRMTSLSNRLSGALLGTLSSLFTTPFLLLALLGTAVTVPLLAWRHKHWLGTAISGHVALAAIVALAFGALKRNSTGHAVASLSDILDPRILDTGVLSLVLIGLVMLVLCALNHAAFFMGQAHPERQR